jgi:cell division protease FtsH
MKFAPATPAIEESKAVVPDQDWLATEEEPPRWDQLPGAKCIARWAVELRDAIAGNADAASWRLVGAGAAIEYKDLGLCESVFRRVARDAGLRFVSIPEHAVMGIPLDASCPFAALAPAMVYLEPGDWMLKIKVEKQGRELADSVRDFRQALKSFMTEFNPRLPVVFATAAFDLDDIAEMLRAPGLFDRRFALRPPTTVETGESFLGQLGLENCALSLMDFPHKVGIVVQGYPNDRVRELHLLHLRRKAARENRRLEFVDLVEVGLQGSVETDELVPASDASLRTVAVHEAGHAVVAMIDSAGSNISEYLSIVAVANCKGVSVDSCTHRYATREQTTYASFRHQIRGYLAGRAAEEVVFGAENVSGGAREDLVHASVLSFEAFALLGFSPNMDCADASASNLAVVVAGDDPSEAEEAHVAMLTRQFLADQYREVLSLLHAHRGFLDEVTQCLLQRRTMDQESLSELGRKYLPFSEVR